MANSEVGNVEIALNQHILDYFKRKGFPNSAESFAEEANLVEHQEKCFELEKYWETNLDMHLPDPVLHEGYAFDESGNMIPTPGRTARLYGSILAYMRTKGFEISAANFAQETQANDALGSDELLIKVFSLVWSTVWLNRQQRSGLDNPPESPNRITNDEPHPSTDVYSVFDSPEFTFKESWTVYKDSSCRIYTCHISSDGKLLAYGGSHKMISFWNLELSRPLTSTRELFGFITDLRFQPHTTHFAASCNNRIVRIGDAKNVAMPLRELEGHSCGVISVDFCPDVPQVLCSCDMEGVICFWNVDSWSMISKFKVDRNKFKQVRFQSKEAVAVAVGNTIVLVSIKLEKEDIKITRQEQLEGHVEDIKSICWDDSRARLASVSHDGARLWSAPWKCDHRLLSDGHKYEACLFHPVYSTLLIIGAYQYMLFWDLGRGDKTRIFSSRSPGFISSLACCRESRLVASASRDSQVKLWNI